MSPVGRVCNEIENPKSVIRRLFYEESLKNIYKKS